MLRKLALLLAVILWPAGRAGAGKSASRELANGLIRAQFDDRGLNALEETAKANQFVFPGDEFELTIDGIVRRSRHLGAAEVRTERNRLTYRYSSEPYQVDVVYELQPGWRFLSKQIRITAPQGRRFHVDDIGLFRQTLGETPSSVQVHKSLFPRLETRDYGAFLHFGSSRGLLAFVQNPFVIAHSERNWVSLGYVPDMDWHAEYGAFVSDRGCLAPYRLSGDRVNLSMVPEWKMAAGSQRLTLDRSEVEAFTGVVRAFLLYKPQKPLRIFVGWCVNDYQIDVATQAGRDEYKRIIDRAAELGAEYVLYAPTNSELGRRVDSADDWHWENLLWLGLGQKIRKNEWDPGKDPIPANVQEMLEYAKRKGVKLVAYVYPVVPFSQNPEWLVRGSRYHKNKLNASLGSRALQDWLIGALTDFQRRTGLGGYAFDYTFLWYNGSSRYAQWWGWRRVMESLRRNTPDIAIDGRQLYMQYGPWTWLAGSYPHPTGTDEQPESFVPFPDLHFDRVSANRQRYTAYWYRNYEFCPAELLPGFITHQTPRLNDAGEMPAAKVAAEKSTDPRWQGGNMVLSAFRERDWDYLGWCYSLLSSIATAGWNHVVNMIPARDLQEYRYFSEADKEWFRDWLDWADRNKELLRNTRTIGAEPAIGRVDGTAAIANDRGFVFLFNPNGRKLPGEFSLDHTIGLTAKGAYQIKEMYPLEGRLAGKRSTGFWTYGDRVSLMMDGTSAVVLEVSPAPGAVRSPVVFNVPANARLEGRALHLEGVRGEAGSELEIVVLLPEKTALGKATVNGVVTKFRQSGSVISVPVHFGGGYFARSQQVGTYDAKFAGGTVKGAVQIPRRVFDQLAARKRAWPILWTEQDLKTPWLAPERLLLFVQIAEPDDGMEVTLQLNGDAVPLKKAYSSIRTHKRSFVGFYADVSSLEAGRPYQVELKLPALTPGQFQGLFFDNVETEYTNAIAR